MTRKRKARRVPTLDVVQALFASAKDVDEFTCRSGLFSLLMAVQHVSDDLNDLIQALRERADYTHSDRARDLQERLRAEMAPLASLHSNALVTLMRQGEY